MFPLVKIEILLKLFCWIFVDKGVSKVFPPFFGCCQVVDGVLWRVNQYPRVQTEERESRKDHARVDLWPEPVRDLAFVRESSEELGCKPDGVVFVPYHILK